MPVHPYRPHEQLHRLRGEYLSREEGTFASLVLAICLDEFGMGAIDWHPDTLRLEVRDTFQTRLSNDNLDKYYAAVTIISTNRFYRFVPDFVYLCNVLSEGSSDARIWDIADPEEILWGVTEAMLLDPPESDVSIEELFHPEIRAYVGEILKQYGILAPPRLLANLAGEYLKDPIARVAGFPSEYRDAWEIGSNKGKELVDFALEKPVQYNQDLSKLFPGTNLNIERLLGAEV